MNTTAPGPGGGQWISGAVAVASLRHRGGSPPCQDAVGASSAGRRYVAALDGRGSSAHSQLGSAAAAAALGRELTAVEPLLARCLDELEPDTAQAQAFWGEATATILRGLRDAQDVAANANAVDSRELEFTVSLAVAGVRGIGLIQLGDGCVLLERATQMVTATNRQCGEYAGETNFLGPDEGSLLNAEATLQSAAGVSAIIAFTDGVAARWLHGLTLAPAPGIVRVIEHLRSGKWTEQDLAQHFDLPHWQGVHDDDRSLAYLIAQVTGPGTEPSQTVGPGPVQVQ